MEQNKLKAQSSNDELQFRPLRNQAALEGLTEKAPDRFTALVAVIEGPVIHVHPDEFVRQVAAHIACELQRMLHRFSAVIEAVTDAGDEDVRNGFANSGLNTLVNRVAAQGQGKAVIFSSPPGAQVFAYEQPLIPKGELPFMN